MAGSPHDYDENGNLKLPAWYGKSNLAMLFAFMLMAAMGASMRLAKRDYNRAAAENWILAGALTSQSVQFKVRLNGNYGQRFLVSTEPIEKYQEDSSLYLMNIPLESLFTQPDATQEFLLYGLDPSRKYYYARVAPNFDMLYQGYVQTAPPENVRSNFTFVTTGSAFSGSQHPIFEEMANENPLFFLHLGNMHYGDVTGDLETRIGYIDKVVGSASQEQLYRRTAFSYMWNDRDYLGKNTLGDEPGRAAALESYKAVIPSHQSPGSPLYQAYTIGTVRFIVSDLRSEVTEDSIMSDEQREWLKTELSNAGDYDFVIWVTPSTWMGDDLTQNDWTGRPADRMEISEMISALPSQNVLVLSAGTEMFAFDDGSHTAYGDFSPNETVMSFPILMSGPADRLGQIVEANYSEGCSTWLYERNHIYSVVEFKENEETLEPCLHIRSYRVTDVTGRKELHLEKDMCGTIFSPMSDDPASGSCQAERFSETVGLMVMIALGLLGADIILGFFVGDGLISGLIMAVMTLIGVFATSATMRYLPSFSYGVDQHEAFVIALILNIQLGLEFIFFLCWAKFHHITRTGDSKQGVSMETDAVRKANTWVEPSVRSNYADGAKDEADIETQEEDLGDEDEENDRFPNYLYAAPAFVSSATSPSSRKSTRSMAASSFAKSKSVPSRLTHSPTLQEEHNHNSLPRSGESSSGTSSMRSSFRSASFAKSKSVPSRLTHSPKLQKEPNPNLLPKGRGPSSGTSSMKSSIRSAAPVSTRLSRPHQAEPMPKKKPRVQPAARSRLAPRQEYDSSLLSLAALIQENAMRTNSSRRGTDPEPCQSIPARTVALTHEPSCPEDILSDASFQSTFETEEESMRFGHGSGIDPSSDDEPDEDFVEAPTGNDLDPSSTSDEALGEHDITESRTLLEPEDCSSLINDSGADNESSVVDNVSDDEHDITESRLLLEPEDGSISNNGAETENESSFAENVSDDENVVAESRTYLEPEDGLILNGAETESESSVAATLSDGEHGISEGRIYLEPEDNSTLDDEAGTENESSVAANVSDDEHDITQNRSYLEPEDRSSLQDDTGTESGSSVGETASDENAIAESRSTYLEPEDNSISNGAETEREAGDAEILANGDNSSTENHIFLEPEDCSSAGTESESRDVEALGADYSDDSKDPSLESEASEDSTFAIMLNSREAPAALISERDDNGMSEGDTTDPVEASVADETNSSNSEVKDEPTLDKSVDNEKDQEEMDSSHDASETGQSRMMPNEDAAKMEMCLAQDAPVTITDDESEPIGELLDDAESDVEEEHANIDPESVFEDKCENDLPRATPSGVVTAAISPAKPEDDTDEGVTSEEEELGLETTFKSEEMEITFVASSSSEEDTVVSDKSEDSFENQFRDHLHPFPESPRRRIAVDP